MEEQDRTWQPDTRVYALADYTVLSLMELVFVNNLGPVDPQNFYFQDLYLNLKHTHTHTKVSSGVFQILPES